MILSFPHFGIHVGDIDASTRFYVDGLGFNRSDSGTVDTVGQLLGIEGAQVRTQFIEHPAGGPRIELWSVTNREAAGSTDPGPANRHGRPHLCVVVEDLDAAAARIVEYGGQRLDESRGDHGYADIMFCADPDGTRIELIQVKSGWTGYAGQGAD
ncbi:MAG: VOC family protein [Novosphingobium sp.]|nr:VOC family protein [Novosphingobium sp.]